jgi:hypothetical protein
VQARAGLLSRGLTKLNEKRQHERKLPLLASNVWRLKIHHRVFSRRALRDADVGLTNTVPAAALREAGADVVTASLADWTVDAVKRLY